MARALLKRGFYAANSERGVPLPSSSRWDDSGNARSLLRDASSAGNHSSQNPLRRTAAVRRSRDPTALGRRKFHIDGPVFKATPSLADDGSDGNGSLEWPADRILSGSDVNASPSFRQMNIRNV